MQSVSYTHLDVYKRQGFGIDSIITLMDQNRRKLLPAASVGLQYEFPEMKQLKLYLLFRQNLLNAYEEDIPLYELSTVSYTHLDVYKRQLLPPSTRLTKLKSGILCWIFIDGYYVNTCLNFFEVDLIISLNIRCVAPSG